jgi:hypothetical protein
VAADLLADQRVRAARGVPLNRAALEAEVAYLAGLEVNYSEDEAPTSPDDPNWHVDSGYAELGTEAPGPPEPGGPFERACRIVRDYEFPDDRILRGIYRRDDPLLGRDMVLEGRFLFLRFQMPVRVTDAYDTVRDGKRVWGWTYQTLCGHLEQGRLSYEVVKDPETGRVTFWIHAYSRRGPVPNPLLRLGWVLFGRTLQLEFYRRAGQRVRELIDANPPGDDEPKVGLVIVPRERPERWRDRFALDLVRPGVCP